LIHNNDTKVIQSKAASDFFINNNKPDDNSYEAAVPLRIIAWI